jgi:hypothetical protein
MFQDPLVPWTGRFDQASSDNRADRNLSGSTITSLPGCDHRQEPLKWLTLLLSSVVGKLQLAERSSETI